MENAAVDINLLSNMRETFEKLENFIAIHLQDQPLEIVNSKKHAWKMFLELKPELTTKLEGWRYTDPAKFLGKISMPPEKTKLLLASKTANLDGFYSITSTNGVAFSSQEFSKSNNLKPLITVFSDLFGKETEIPVQLRNLIIKNFATRSYSYSQADALFALNAALAEDTLLIYVTPEMGEVKIKIDHLLSTLSDKMVNLRVIFVLEDRAQATIIEQYNSQNSFNYFLNGSIEALVGQKAKLNYTRILLGDETATHYARVAINSSQDACVKFDQINLGCNTVRNEILFNLNGKNFDGHLNGLTIADGDQHIDNFTEIDNRAPNCFSRELFKGVYAGRARGAFCGSIIVRREGQKTNAIQSNQTILLSETAEINSKPQLKIWADDVKCTHGATVGKLNEEALFYSRSRGIDLEASRKILLMAFVGEVVSQIEDPSVRSYVSELVNIMIDKKISGSFS